MKKLLCLLLLMCGLSTFAATDLITATVTVTNTVTTNGQTIVINGNTRTWTNTVYVPATQILTNNTAVGVTTNLFNQISITPAAGLSLSYSSSTSMALRAFPGASLTVTLSAGWGAVSYATQVLTTAISVRVPNTVEAIAQRTNIATALVDWINLTAATNQLMQASPAMAQLVGLTNNQTITGNKTMTGTNVLGYISTGTNGVLQSTALVNPGITNATSISGNLLLLTNGTLRDAILISPIMTNGVNYGDAFRSPGSGSGSEQFGASASATGSGGIAIGSSAVASGATGASAIGNDAEATNGVTTAVGTGAKAWGSGSTALGWTSKAHGNFSLALGAGATIAATHINSTALGFASVTTASNQVRLGTSSEYVSIPGNLTVDGVVSNLATRGTNTFPAGSDIAFGRFAITSVANGANAALPVGTNVFVDITGSPTAAWTLAGIDGQPNRNGKHIWLVNRTGYGMTIAHQSGLDPTAANRIICPGAEDVVMSGDGVAELIYNATASRWNLLNAYASAIGVGGDASSLTNIPHIIAEAYSSSNLTSSVSFSGSGVWTDVTNVLELTSGSMAGWVVTNLSASATNCALVYTNAPTLHLHTATSLSFVPTSGAGSIKTYHFRMKQNATGLYRGEVVDSGAASGGLESTALHTFMVINTGDVLSLEVMNETDTTGVRLQTVNIFSMAMK